MNDIKKLLDEARERLAERADTMDYSHCSDSSIVIGFRKGWNANKEIIMELVEALRAIKNGGLPSGQAGNTTDRMLAMCDLSTQVLAKLEARLRGSE